MNTRNPCMHGLSQIEIKFAVTAHSARQANEYNAHSQVEFVRIENKTRS